MTRSLIALTLGTLLGLGAITHAATGGGSPWSSSGTLIAQADPPPPPKRGPAPPTPPATPRTGVTVSVDNGKIMVSGVRELVEKQINNARKKIASDPNIPKDVRDKLTARMDRARSIVDKRLANLKVSDMDDFGDEMEKMGEELAKEMAGLEDEMEKLAESLGKAHGMKLDLDLDFDHDDDDDDHDVPMAPDVDIDQDDKDLRDAINDLKDLAVKPTQRDAITKLRTDSDKTVSDAKKKVDDLSRKLHTALGSAGTSDAEIGTLVDQISAQEAVIRKARIVAWNQARRVLDDNQRKKIDAATPKKTK